MSQKRAQFGALIERADQRLGAGDVVGACPIYRKALKLDKNNAHAMLRLGQALMMSGEFEESIEILRSAARKNPNSAPVHTALGEAHLANGDADHAERSLARALSSDPSHAPAIIVRVTAQLDSGCVEEAAAIMGTVEEHAGEHPLIGLARARVQYAQRRHGDAIGTLERVLGTDGLEDQHRRIALHEMGHALDKLGEYDRAFPVFEEANHGLMVVEGTDADAVMHAWSADTLASIPDSGIGDERPVIIAGLPRSGTTLLERVIHAHPEGFGVGECPAIPILARRHPAGTLDADTTAMLGRTYLEQVGAQSPKDAARIADKHMESEKTLGFVSRITPGARVIQALRDPRDCCLSAYFHNFGVYVPYSRSLEALGRAYVAFRRLMSYWTERLALRQFVCVYEEFVEEPEPFTRSLMDFLGLEYDEACLRFHESREHVRTYSAAQVRRPINTSSTSRWKNYEKHLSPLLDALGPYADGVHATSGASLDRAP
jgi:tetratricopeptide (TPR) repeat protein